MAETAGKNPTATYDAGDFTNPNNGWTDNGSYATVSTGGFEDVIYNGFSFGLASGDTITGIKVVFNCKESASGDNYGIEAAIYNGTSYTAQKTSTPAEPGTTDTDLVYGGAGDLWGLSWGAATIDTYFRVDVAMEDWGTNSGAFSLDAVTVTIYYDPGTTTSTTKSTSTSSTTTSSSTSRSTSTSKSTSTSSTTTSSSTSRSTSTTISTSTTTTLAVPAGLAFGEENPTQGETPISWQTWSDGTGSIPTVTGDADWGKINLELNEEGRSRVYDFGNADNKGITLTEDRYEAGQESATLQIRGSADTSFNQDDVGPTWENYISSIPKVWRYIQVRAIKNT